MVFFFPFFLTPQNLIHRFLSIAQLISEFESIRSMYLSTDGGLSLFNLGNLTLESIAQMTKVQSVPSLSMEENVVITLDSLLIEGESNIDVEIGGNFFISGEKVLTLSVPHLCYKLILYFLSRAPILA